MMKQYIILILFIFLLVGCQQSEENDEYERDIPKIDEEMYNEIEKDTGDLKEGIANLLDEDNYSLEVKYLEDDFYPASDYFATRILELLARDLEPDWKDSTINNHQLEFKFEGYKTIYINTDLETYWFEGSDKIFSANGIKELWDRYIVKFVDNKPIYYGFEKTILSKIDYYMDEDNNEHVLLLFYDGDIRLSVDESEIIIQEEADLLKHYGNRTQYYSGMPKTSAGLEYIDALGLLMYTYEGIRADGPFTNVKFYRYTNSQIVEVFSSSNIDVEVDISNISTGTVELKLPFENINKELQLTDEEVESYEQAITEILESGININEAEFMLIKDNIVYNEKAIIFEDYDNDDKLELMLYGNLKTYGALTPIHFNDKVILVFNLYSDRIECIDVILDRDVGSESSPFEYFT